MLLFDEVAVEADDDAIEEDVGDMTTGVVWRYEIPSTPLLSSRGMSVETTPPLVFTSSSFCREANTPFKLLRIAFCLALFFLWDFASGVHT